MSALLLAALAISWLAISLVFVAACRAAAHADRLDRSSSRSERGLSNHLRLVERDILRG